MKKTLLTVLLAAWAASFAGADWIFDFELGPVYTHYNDVAVPGDTGTRFSLGDFDQDQAVSFRLRVSYLLADRHWFSFLAAPLSVYAQGEASKAINFNGTSFAAGDSLDTTYRFDTYRLSYRYNFITGRELEFGLGLTGLLRDAAITLKSSSAETTKSNVGFVPLVNFHAYWRPSKTFSLILDGDALVAPQGRAEDVLLAFQFHYSSRIVMRAGYRVLEGGADNDEVYTFALFHYVIFGLEYRF